MLYARNLDPVTEELLMVSADKVMTVNHIAHRGTRDGDIYVDFMAGLKLSPMRVTVQ